MRSGYFRPLCVFFMLVAAGFPPAGARPAEGSRPVLREHPRLFLTSSNLAAVEARARGKLRDAYARMLRDCQPAFDDRKLGFTVSNPSYLLSRTLALLVARRVEKADAFRDKALSLGEALVGADKGRSKRDTRVRLQSLAILYDGLYADLPAADRARWREALAAAYRDERGALDLETEFVSGHAHFTTASVIIALLALADGSGEFEPDLERALAQWEKFQEVARHVAADGGYHLGWRYGRSYTSRIAWVCEAITNATGRDVFAAERPWLSQLGYHLLYGLRPDDTYFRVGDSHRKIHVNLDEDVLLEGILSSRYRDPHLAWMAWHSLETSMQHGYQSPDAELVFALLFLDPDIDRKPPGDLPPVRAFPRSGNYVMRTGWGPDDTAVLFRAMPWYHFNHVRRDFGSFLIYCHGGLAVHGGLYQGGDEESDYGGTHLANYAWRTAAHNTITVFDPGERFCKPTGPGREACEGDARWSNDGGQKIRSREHDDVPVPWFQPRNVRDIVDPRFAQGSVPAYEDRPELTYVLADGTKAYRADKVKLFERRFFFLKQVEGWKRPVVVVLDRVTSVNPEHRKAWLLHVVEEPRINGKTFSVENSKRVRFTGERQSKPTDDWRQYSGRLLGETLLPGDARVEFIGGPGKEFWVDGKNYAAEVREIDEICEPGIGRIEVSPGSPRATDVFLNVLAPTDTADAAPLPPSKVLESNAIAACLVGDRVLVAADSTVNREGVDYKVDRPGPAVHCIAGLAPSRQCTIQRDGKTLETQSSSAQGLLVFRAPAGGAFHVAAGPASR